MPEKRKHTHSDQSSTHINTNTNTSNHPAKASESTSSGGPGVNVKPVVDSKKKIKLPSFGTLQANQKTPEFLAKSFKEQQMRGLNYEESLDDAALPNNDNTNSNQESATTSIENASSSSSSKEAQPPTRRQEQRLEEEEKDVARKQFALHNVKLNEKALNLTKKIEMTPHEKQTVKERERAKRMKGQSVHGS